MPPEQPISPPPVSPHQSSPSSPSFSRPRTPRPRNSPRLQPRIHRSSSYLSVNGGPGSAEGSPRLSPMADPQHHRAPSLGELHQELESEQEGRVNRLLGMIRQQQAQLDTVSAPTSTSNTAQPDRSRTPSITRPALTIPASSSSSSTTATTHHPPHRTSLTSTTLPHLSLGNPTVRSPGHPIESPDWMPREKERDELAYYQAEVATMQRENKMLQVRIAELERLVAGKVEVGKEGLKEGEDGDRGRR